MSNQDCTVQAPPNGRWIEFNWRSIPMLDTPEYSALAERYRSDAEFRSTIAGDGWCQAVLSQMAAAQMSEERREQYRCHSLNEKHRNGYRVIGVDDGGCRSCGKPLAGNYVSAHYDCAPRQEPRYGG